MESYYKKYKTAAVISGLLFVVSAMILLISVLTSESGFVFDTHIFTLVISLGFAVWFFTQLFKLSRLKKTSAELVKTFAVFVGQKSKTFGIYRPYRILSLTVEIKKENGETITMSTPFEYFDKQVGSMQIGENLPISYSEKANILIINRDFKKKKLSEDSDVKDVDSDN